VAIDAASVDLVPQCDVTVLLYVQVQHAMHTPRAIAMPCTGAAIAIELQRPCRRTGQHGARARASRIRTDTYRVLTMMPRTLTRKYYATFIILPTRTAAQILHCSLPVQQADVNSDADFQKYKQVRTRQSRSGVCICISPICCKRQ